MAKPEMFVPIATDLNAVRCNGLIATLRVLVRAMWSEFMLIGMMLVRRDGYGRAARLIVAVAVLGLIIHGVLLVGLKYENPIARWLWALGMLQLDRDRSLFEFFEYGLLCVAAFAMWRAGTAHQSSLLRMIAVIYLYLLADNAFRIHETAGKLLPFEKSYGELVFFAGTAVVILGLLVFGFIADRGRLTVITLVNGAGFALLAVFAVATDFAHAQFASVSRTIDYGFAFIEDGGEMLTITLIALYSLTILMRMSPASEDE